MEPNQSANPSSSSASNAAPDAQAQNIQQPVTQYQNPAAENTSQQPSTTDNKSSSSNDGKNWMEYAGLQKVVDQLPQGVRDFLPNSWDKINQLSTTQKVAGAVALAGLGYLALRPGKSSSAAKSSSKAGSKYKSAYGSSQPATGQTQRYGQSTRSASGYSASTSDDSRRLDQGPGWWNSGSQGPDASSSRADRTSGSASNSAADQRNLGYRSGASATRRNTDADSDFGSAI